MLRWMAVMAFAAALWTGLAGAEPVAVDDEGYPANDLEILQPPQPEYPGVAAFFGLEGMCEVRFDLLAGGSVVSVREVACTLPVFCAAARKGVMRTKARVIDVPGARSPGERTNIVYPLKFQMSPGERDWKTTKPCTADLVS